MGTTRKHSLHLPCESYIDGNWFPSVFLSSTDHDDIQNIIESLKDNCACGRGEVRAKILKAVSSIVLAPLAHICNIMMLTGKFPNKMRESRVTPIRKGGSLHDLKNYRPIYILSIFSEIAEHIIYKRTTVFLNFHNIIAKEQQYGFFKSKSAETALLRLKKRDPWEYRK